ncbi:HAMP domain-containing sensor histidine kinase [Sulfuricurvum sp.]|uniref:sensor histidine kinase n=1 Tax=Sulfuricurvum sp. TaxID=2025608 RepID=UPI00260ABC90|nr:HAMP domain-containing sensor histidine kinase [Sulfuricurvum sp.]MDD2782099.1 HAMP domain-containing sensor histidine kinase [Sulfuricurvum sp.]
MRFKWVASLKFKISLIFFIGLAIAFSINLLIAVKTVHVQKEEEVENVLTHLLVESTDEYISTSLNPSSNVNFLYTIPHNIMIVSDSEVNALHFVVSANPYRTNDKLIVSSIKLSNNYYLNAISDHQKIDKATYKYTQKLLIRYMISLLVILFIIIFALDFYMKPLELLAIKTREWKRENPFDFVQENVSSEIKEVSSAFASLVKRMEEYRRKESELFKEAAHELKTPLALMRSRLDVYEQSNVYEKSKFIQELSHDLERLTAELKNVLFLESSDFEEAIDIDLHAMLTKLKEKMDILIQRKNLQINISQSTFEVKAAEKLMYKVCGALIENAITYAAYNSIIHISIDGQLRIIEISNHVGNDKYLFSSKIGNKILSRLSKEIGYEYTIKEMGDLYSIQIQFNEN